MVFLPVVPLTSVEAFLEYTCPPCETEFTVPTSAPARPISEIESTSEFDLQFEHALSNSVLLPASLGFAIARVIDNGKVLELRWSSFTRKADANEMQTEYDNPGPYTDLDEAALPPVRFVFPQRIVPSIALVEHPNKSAIFVTVLTENGYLFRLTFTGPGYFCYPEYFPEQYSTEYAVSLLTDRTPVLLHGIDCDTILIACTDGTLIKLDQTISHNNQDPLVAVNSSKLFTFQLFNQM